MKGYGMEGTRDERGRRDREGSGKEGRGGRKESLSARFGLQPDIENPEKMP